MWQSWRPRRGCTKTSAPSRRGAVVRLWWWWRRNCCRCVYSVGVRRNRETSTVSTTVWGARRPGDEHGGRRRRPVTGRRRAAQALRDSFAGPIWQKTPQRAQGVVTASSPIKRSSTRRSACVCSSPPTRTATRTPRLLRESYALERRTRLASRRHGRRPDGERVHLARALLAAARARAGSSLGTTTRRRSPRQVLRIAGQPRASRVLQSDDATLYFLDRRDWWSFDRVNATGPALAFIHEPLPQYALPRRELVEPVSPAESGSLWPMLRQRGVVATFAGHDHLNSDCGRWSGVWLCYAGSLGGYGRDDAPGAQRDDTAWRLRPARARRRRDAGLDHDVGAARRRRAHAGARALARVSDPRRVTATSYSPMKVRLSRVAPVSRSTSTRPWRSAYTPGAPRRRRTTRRRASGCRRARAP